VKLGNPNVREAGAIGAKATRDKAKRFNDKLRQVVTDIKETGVTSSAEVARCLNRRGFKSAHGKPFTGPNVARILRAS